MVWLCKRCFYLLFLFLVYKWHTCNQLLMHTGFLRPSPEVNQGMFSLPAIATLATLCVIFLLILIILAGVILFRKYRKRKRPASINSQAGSGFIKPVNRFQVKQVKNIFEFVRKYMFVNELEYFLPVLLSYTKTCYLRTKCSLSLFLGG